jgi:hypothetical protein
MSLFSRRCARARHVLAIALVLVGAVGIADPARAQAPDSVGLGTADNFAVLAGQGVTNTGPTTVTGDVGTSPNPSVTGAGLTVIDGTIHAADAVAAQAQTDLVVAYDDAAGRPAAEVATELGGQLLTAGAYDSASGTFEITGTLTLDAEGDPDAVFVFQAASTLLATSGSTVAVINGGSACNVFWQVGSSATLGTSSTLRGTVMALASITIETGATLQGRALARNGAVTLDSDTITRTACTTPTTTETTVTSTDDPTNGTQTTSATVTATGGGSPTGTVAFLDEDGQPVGSGVVQGGLATITTTLAPGEHQITAVYLGGPGFAGSTSQTITLLVATPTQASGPTTTTAVPTPTTSGTATTLPRAGNPPTLPVTGGTNASLAYSAALLIALGVSTVVLAGRRK